MIKHIICFLETLSWIYSCMHYTLPLQIDLTFVSLFTTAGKIPYYTMPPKRNAEVLSEAKIVTELAKVFNVDEVYESSFIGSLKSMNEFNPVEVPSNNPLNFDTSMLEVVLS